MGNETSRTNRRTALLIGALVILGLAGGAVVRVWFSGKGSGSGAAPPGQTASFKPTLSPGAAAAWANLLNALGKQDPKRLPIARVVELLRAHKDDEVARAFADDFANEPRLMDIWRQYIESLDSLDAPWVAKQLSQAPEFALLLNKYEPRFGRLSGDLARQIEDASKTGAATLAHGDSRLQTVPPVGGFRYGAQANPNAVAGAGPVQGGTGASPPAPTPKATPAPTGVTVAGNPTRVSNEEMVVDTREQKPLDQGNSDAHDVGTLAALGATGPDSEAVQYLASVFQTIPRQNRDKLLRLCTEDSGYCDPIKSCDAAEIWDECLAACNANPKCKGSMPHHSPSATAPEPPPSGPEPAAPGTTNTQTNTGTNTGATPSSVAGDTSPSCPHGSHKHVHRHGFLDWPDDRHCKCSGHHRIELEDCD